MTRYLDPDPNAIIRQVRHRNPQWFDHAEAVATFAGEVVQCLHVHHGNVRELLAALLFRRIASGFEACLALAERGMHTEGLTQRRSMLEALFVLGAIWKQPDFADKYLLNDQHRRLKIFKNIKRVSPFVQQSPSPEIPIESIDEKIDDLKLSIGNSTPTNVADYAKAADLFDYYLTDYSFASEAAHHVAKDLERQIALDSEGNVDGLYWGPEADAPSDLLSSAVEYMLMAVVATEALFEMTASETCLALQARTNELIDIYAGVTNVD